MNNVATIPSYGKRRQVMIPNGIETSANCGLNHLEINLLQIPEVASFKNDAK